ncbi:MAG: hypothetical protein RIM99_02085 [Cyclobacteriaceae bacterium]
MKLIKQIGWLCSMLSIGFLISCIEDAGLDEFDFSEKLLILGYVGDHNEPARVNILGSVPITAKGRKSRPVRDATVSLMELTREEEIISYPMIFDPSRELYLTEDSSIAKIDHSYWLEVNVEERLWKSQPTRMTSRPKVNISEPVHEDDLNRDRYEVDVIDDDEYYSYIIGDYGQGIDLFLTTEYYFYYDKELRIEAELSTNVYLYSPSKTYDPYVYIMQVPPGVDEFFREWQLQFDNTDDPDFFTQMLSIPPGNLSGNIMDESDQPAKDVIGVFFSGFTIKHRQE